MCRRRCICHAHHRHASGRAHSIVGAGCIWQQQLAQRGAPCVCTGIQASWAAHARCLWLQGPWQAPGPHVLCGAVRCRQMRYCRLCLASTFCVSGLTMTAWYLVSRWHDGSQGRACTEALWGVQAPALSACHVQGVCSCVAILRMCLQESYAHTHVCLICQAYMPLCRFGGNARLSSGMPSYRPMFQAPRPYYSMQEPNG